MIPLEECKHRGLYKIQARNFSYGVFNKNQNGFVGIREKFSRKFLFTEFHHDTGPPYGTVKPLEFIEMCPLTEVKPGWHEDFYIENTELYEWIQKRLDKVS